MIKNPKITDKCRDKTTPKVPAMLFIPKYNGIDFFNPFFFANIKPYGKNTPIHIPFKIMRSINIAVFTKSGRGMRTI